MGLREDKKQATRAALSWAAVRLTVERGWDNVLVDDIAAAAGVSPRTFNNYFSSKGEAIAARHLDRYLLLADNLRHRPPAEPLWDALRAAVVGIMQPAPELPVDGSPSGPGSTSGPDSSSGLGSPSGPEAPSAAGSLSGPDSTSAAGSLSGPDSSSAAGSPSAAASPSAPDGLGRRGPDVALDRERWLAGVRVMVEHPAHQAEFSRAGIRAEAKLAEVIAERTGTELGRDLYPHLTAAAVMATINTSTNRWMAGPQATDPRADAATTITDQVVAALTLLSEGLPPPGRRPEQTPQP
ncbi:TetR family transcriptional regulator [Actinoplanes sp. NPDC051470]|uniref:acyl-CoA-like ligand-binding transcription factor n=1 Tax=Actinoplanes sp. NPDC051470 TaxID=3157224 RepID=UPI0034431B5F